MNLHQLGEKVFLTRRQANITQKQLALTSGLSDVTIRSIEKGDPGVSIQNWITVAEILGLEFKLEYKQLNHATGKGNE
jgi:DNA-binding XRE family transcriptional regulator